MAWRSGGREQRVGLMNDRGVLLVVTGREKGRETRGRETKGRQDWSQKCRERGWTLNACKTGEGKVELVKGRRREGKGRLYSSRRREGKVKVKVRGSWTDELPGKGMEVCTCEREGGGF